jgi:hypothetical protein
MKKTLLIITTHEEQACTRYPRSFKIKENFAHALIFLDYGVFSIDLKYSFAIINP